MLIDMWATWCKNCLTMDKTTLENEEVKKALDGLRQNQVSGGRSRRGTCEVGDGAVQGHRIAGVRDPAAEERGRHAVNSTVRSDWSIPVRRLIATALFVSVVGLVGIVAQVPAVIADVRKAIAANDFALGDKLLASYRAANGVTPDMLEALSWMGRGSLAAKQLDNAEKYARETYQLATAELKRRKLDQEPRFPLRSAPPSKCWHKPTPREARAPKPSCFSIAKLRPTAGTSIEKRLRKNLNLLSLEGRPAPAIDVSEYLGAKPPTVAELKGKPVLMFFWAHWCGDCKAQSPILARLLDTYGPKGLVIFAPTQRFGYVAGGKTAPADEETRYIDQTRQNFYPVLAQSTGPDRRSQPHALRREHDADARPRRSRWHHSPLSSGSHDVGRARPARQIPRRVVTRRRAYRAPRT